MHAMLLTCADLVRAHPWVGLAAVLVETAALFWFMGSSKPLFPDGHAD